MTIHIPWVVVSLWFIVGAVLYVPLWVAGTSLVSPPTTTFARLRRSYRRSRGKFLLDMVLMIALWPWAVWELSGSFVERKGR